MIDKAFLDFIFFNLQFFKALSSSVYLEKNLFISNSGFPSYFCSVMFYFYGIQNLEREKFAIRFNARHNQGMEIEVKEMF